jgi:hypothetical protein
MAKAKMETNSADQTIEQLQERYGKLNTKKIEADRDLKHAMEHLESLKKEARENFGTDDVDELRKKLAAMRAENEEKRKNYQADLDKIEADLANVEKNLSADDAEGGNSEENA